jgi:proteasome lid subunit RPN8/RPN11
LLFLRDQGETEVGGFGVTSPDDPLRVVEFHLVGQECTPVTVAFDDQAVADFFDRQVDLGRQPAEFGRIWIHTHPGSSPRPSEVDEETFIRAFGRSDWAVMFIIARGGESYARLRFNVGPGGALEIPVSVDYGRPFDGSDEASWEREYQANVVHVSPMFIDDDFFRSDRFDDGLFQAQWDDVWGPSWPDDQNIEPEDVPYGTACQPLFTPGDARPSGAPW